MDANQFMQTVPGGRKVRPHRFDPHLDGILKLRAAGYTLAQVSDWLRGCGVKAPASELSTYLQRKAK